MKKTLFGKLDLWIVTVVHNWVMSGVAMKKTLFGKLDLNLGFTLMSLDLDCRSHLGYEWGVMKKTIFGKLDLNLWFTLT